MSTADSGCQVCGEIATSLTVNVDDAPPPVLRALSSPVTAHCSLPGMGGFGLRRCPACGAWFYSDWEQSLTGSGTNDHQSTYRLSPTEAAMLGLPPGTGGVPPPYVEVVLERVCAGMQVGVGPFKIAVAVLQAIHRLAPADAAAAAQALVAVALRDPGIRKLVADAARGFDVGATDPEIARQLAACSR